jgi:hypothetical protein
MSLVGWLCVCGTHSPPRQTQQYVRVCEKAKQLQLSQQEHGNHQNNNYSSSSREFVARPHDDFGARGRLSRAQTFNSSSGWEAYAGPGAAKKKKRTATLIGNSKERPREAEAREQPVVLPPSTTYMEPGPGGDGAHATVDTDASGAQLTRHRPGGPSATDGEPLDDDAVSIVVTSAPTEEHEQQLQLQQGEVTATARGRTATWLSAHLPEEHDEHERLSGGGALMSGQHHQASSAPSTSAVYEEPANITRLRSRSAGFPHRQGTR